MVDFTEPDFGDFEFLLEPGTHPDVVEAIVMRLVSSSQVREYGLALGYRRLFRDNIHRARDFRKFGAYAEARLKDSARRASALSFLGKHLERLPKVRKALATHELDWTKAREFVARATPEDEEEWVEFCKTHNSREVEQRVYGKETKRPTTQRLTPEEEQAVRKVREQTLRKTGEYLGKDAVLGRLAKDALSGEGLFGGCAPEGTEKTPPKNGSGKYATVGLCVRCLDTWVPLPGEDRRVPIATFLSAVSEGAKLVELLSDFLCDCEGEKHRKDACPHYQPPFAPAPKSRYIPKKVREFIEARGGFRCETPGCGEELPLDGSHLRPYRDGTPPLREYLALHCSGCNQSIEQKQLRVMGTAPYARYYDRHGEFLGFGYQAEREESRPRNTHVGENGRPVKKPPGKGKSGA